MRCFHALLSIAVGVILLACDDGAADADPDPTEDAGPADASPDGGADAPCPTGWSDDRAGGCSPPILAICDHRPGSFPLPDGTCSTPPACDNGWLPGLDGFDCLPPAIDACPQGAFAVPGGDRCTPVWVCPDGWVRDGIGCVPGAPADCADDAVALPGGGCLAPLVCAGDAAFTPDAGCGAPTRGCDGPGGLRPEVGDCRPLPTDACGADPPGVPDDAVWVDAAAAPGGDGRRLAPFTTLEQAAAAGADTVVLRTGEYVAPDPWPFAVARGTCARDVRVTGRVTVPEGFAADFTTLTFPDGLSVNGTARIDRLVLSVSDASSGLRVRGRAFANGLRVADTRIGARIDGGAHLACSDCVFERLAVIGVVVLADASAALSDTVVADVARDPDASLSGVGVYVDPGGRLEGGDLTLTDLADAGLNVLGTVDLQRVWIRDVTGHGAVTASGASVDLEDLRIEGTGLAGISAYDATVRGARWTLRSTNLGGAFAAVWADAGGRAEATDVDIAGPTTPLAGSGGGVLALQRVRTRSPAPAEVTDGAALMLDDGALVLEGGAESAAVFATDGARVELARAHVTGDVAAGSGGRLTLTDVAVDAASVGVSVRDEGSAADLARVVVDGAVQATTLLSVDGGEMVARDVALRHATGRGVRADRAQLDLERIHVRDVRGSEAAGVQASGSAGRLVHLDIAQVFRAGLLLNRDGLTPRPSTLEVQSVRVSGVVRTLADIAQGVNGSGTGVVMTAPLAVTLDGLSTALTAGPGLLVIGEGTVLRGGRVVVTDSGNLDGDQVDGGGVVVARDADAELTDVRIERAVAQGLFVSEARARIHSLAVQDVRVGEVNDGDPATRDGEGIATVRADVEVTQFRVVDATAAGVIVGGGDVRFERGSIFGTRAERYPDGSTFAAGVLMLGGRATLQDVALADNAGPGVIVAAEGEADLTRVIVNDPATRHSFAYGIVSLAAAQVRVHDSYVNYPAFAGLLAASATLEAHNTSVGGARPGLGSEDTYCVWADARGVVRLSDVTLVQCGEVALGAFQSTIEAERVAIIGEGDADGDAVYADLDSTIRLTGFRIEGHDGNGLVVSDSAATLRDGWIVGNATAVLRQRISTVQQTGVRFLANDKDEVVCSETCYERPPPVASIQTPPPPPPLQ